MLRSTQHCGGGARSHSAAVKSLNWWKRCAGRTDYIGEFAPTGLLPHKSMIESAKVARTVRKAADGIR